MEDQAAVDLIFQVIAVAVLLLVKEM
jgi:hypothetical protein